MASVFTRRDGETANGAYNARIAQLGLRGDDRVGDVMIDGLSRPNIDYQYVPSTKHSWLGMEILKSDECEGESYGELRLTGHKPNELLA
jgi:hypothetical protein